LFAAVDMAYGAVTAIADGPLRTHGGITDVGEIVMRPAEADHDIRTVVGEQVLTGMDAMHKQIEVDALRGYRLIGNHGGRGPPRDVRIRRIVAQHAIL